MYKQDEQTERLRGFTPALVLAVLEDEKELHGYGIVRALVKRSKDKFAFSEASIYPILQTLEDQGIIEHRWDYTKPSRPRKLYYLTPKGRTDLATKRNSIQDFFQTLALMMGGTLDGLPG